MPLVVMKIVGAKYGNKNVKMIFGKKMMLCNDEIYWGKIATTNLPLRLLTTTTHPQYIFLILDGGSIKEEFPKISGLSVFFAND